MSSEPLLLVTENVRSVALFVFSEEKQRVELGGAGVAEAGC
jgi:hypothetical protein